MVAGGIMRSRINAGDEPPFYELDEYRFQKLCRDIMYYEPNIRLPLIYGIRGEKQYGVDILNRRTIPGIEVGQCKCYQRFSPADIKQASQEFLDAWNHWESQTVKRFILLVTADVSSTKHQQVISDEIQRFHDLGIDYEIWPPEILQLKLQAHPSLIARYFDNPAHWIQRICGVITTSSPSQLLGSNSYDISGSTAYHHDQIDLLAGTLSLEFDRRFEEIQRQWKEGYKDEVRGWLYEISANTKVWDQLSTTLRAKILRFEARVALELDRDKNDRPNTYRATQLLDQAYKLEPSYIDHVAQALIAYYENRIDDAIALIHSSTDIDYINLHVALLLDSGLLEQATEIVERPGVLMQATADTFRIRAILFLRKGELHLAQQAIQQATNMQPRWESIQLAGAFINYWSSISHLLVTTVMDGGPEPVDGVFIKQDNDSLTRLISASEIFGILAERAYTNDSRHKYLQWRLAALANHPDQQANAQELCESLLYNVPHNTLVIRWILARRYNVNLNPSEKALLQRIKEKTGSVDELVTLFQIALSNQNSRRAGDVLRQGKYLLDDNPPLSQRLTLQLGIFKNQRKAIKAALLLSNDDHENLFIKFLALKKETEQTGNWLQFQQQTTLYWKITGYVEYLIELTDYLASQKNWTILCHYWEDLVAIACPIPVQKAAISLFYSEKFVECLGLIDQSSSLFRNNELPIEMKRMKAWSLMKLGKLIEAASEAKALSDLAPTTENLFVLLQIYIEQGDITQVAIIARKLHSDPNLGSHETLRLAALIKSQDLSLARILWKRATTQLLDQDLVGPAFGLGMELGLDAEMRDLSTQLMDLAADRRGGVQSFGIPDLLRFAEERNKHYLELLSLYHKGNAPLHIIADTLNISLIDWYHHLLLMKEQGIPQLIAPPLLILHGSRNQRILPRSSDKPWRLHMDITALLLAEHFQILDEVENTFAPIQIPSGIIPSLLKLRQQVEFHQPSRFVIYRQLLRLIARNSIHVLNINQLDISPDPQVVRLQDTSWAKLSILAQKRGGYLIDYLPLMTSDQNERLILPAETMKHLTNCKAVLDSLRHYGQLTESQYQSARDAFGNQGQQLVDAPIPSLGQNLYFHANTIEFFIQAGIIDILTQHFQVFIESKEEEIAKNTLAYQDHQEEMLEWIDHLRNRITRGLAAKIYERMPETTAERKEREDSYNWIHSQCQVALFSFPVNHGDVIWIDDRFATEYIHRDGAPIVGMADILYELSDTGTISKDQYFEILNRMRASDIRYIAIDADEIIHALSNADLNPQGQVIETRTLANIRRYISRCLSQRDQLQWPPVPDREPPHRSERGEVDFVLATSRAIESSIFQIWNANLDIATCSAYAAWIVDNLIVDPLMVRTVLGLPTEQMNYPFLVASHLVSLLLKGFDFLDDSLDEKPLNGRKAYFQWLENQLLYRRFRANPHLLNAVVNILKAYLIDLLGMSVDTLPEDMYRHITDKPETLIRQIVAMRIHSFYEDLPESIHRELTQDHMFMEMIGITFLPAIHFGQMAFERESFWAAVSSTLASTVSEIFPIGEAEPVRFVTLQDEEQQELAIFSLKDKQMLVIDDPIFFMGSNELTLLESILRKNRQWFDCNNDNFEEAIASILCQREAKERFKTVEQWRRNNGALYYQRIQTKMQNHEPFQPRDLYPHNITMLLQHFRIDNHSSKKFTIDSINTASEILLQEVGLTEAIMRLSRLPIALPMNVLTTLIEMPFDLQRQHIKELLCLGKTPLGTIHLLRILIHLRGHQSSYLRLARWVLRSLIRLLENDTVVTFLSVLQWVHQSTDSWIDTELCTPETRLIFAWGHAEQVFRILTNVGVDLEWIRANFQRSWEYTLQLFKNSSSITHDIASPQDQHPLEFCLAGLSYAFPMSITSLGDENINQRLLSLFFIHSNEMLVPSTILFINPSSTPNILGSFLGDDRHTQIEGLFGIEAANLVSITRQSAFKHCIDTLKEDITDEDTWIFLDYILGNKSPLPEFKQPLLTILGQVNMINLCQTNPRLGLRVLQVASQIAVVLEDREGCRHLYHQLAPLAKFLADQDTIHRWQEDQERIILEKYISAIIEASFKLSIAAYPDQSRVLVFSDILQNMIDANPKIAPHIRAIVHHLAYDLPFEDAQYIWPLLFRLRSQL